jgi:hypothetical protein
MIPHRVLYSEFLVSDVERERWRTRALHLVLMAF